MDNSWSSKAATEVDGNGTTQVQRSNTWKITTVVNWRPESLLLSTRTLTRDAVALHPWGDCCNAIYYTEFARKREHSEAIERDKVKRRGSARNLVAVQRRGVLRIWI